MVVVMDFMVLRKSTLHRNLLNEAAKEAMSRYPTQLQKHFFSLFYHICLICGKFATVVGGI